MSKELIYWANQHGQGIVIKGELAKRIEMAASLVGETPEDFVMNALRTKVNEKLRYGR